MRRYGLLVLTLVLVILSACSTKPADDVQQTPISPPPPGQGLSTLAGQIMQHAQEYQGQKVTLVGYFRGLDILDEVLLDPPTNRLRDWVIKDDSGAIYVSHQGLLPFPHTSHEVWRIVRVSGQVEVHRNGMPYIVPTTVEWEGLKEEYDILPAFCTFAVHRFGGPDQLDHHLYWYTLRQLVVYDTKTQWRAAAPLKKGEIYDWERALKKAKFFDLPPVVGEECEGCVRYVIAAVNDKKEKPHFVTVYEGSIPDKLQAFIDLMIEKSSQAKPVE